MQTFNIYVGSNNNTKQLELDHINAIASANHDGFTLYTATGHWLGTEEATAVLIIHDEPAKIKATIERLRMNWTRTPSRIRKRQRYTLRKPPRARRGPAWCTRYTRKKI